MPRDYKFPPISGFGNPAHLWHFNYGGVPIQLTGHRGRALLMVAKTKTVIHGFKFGPYGPIGTIEHPGKSAWRWVGGEETIYPAATIARSSSNTDMPPKTWVPDLMTPTINFGRTLFTGVEPTDIASAAAGVIDLIDTGGQLEYLLDYIWDGAKVTIKRGPADQPFSSWAEVGIFTAAACIGSLDKKTIRLRDLGWKLATAFHDETYDGSGGLGGDDTLKGTAKPYAVGYLFNITPVSINAASQIFQFSFMPSAAIYDLRHGGASIAFYQDYPTFEALQAATGIPSGMYGSCLAQSLVRPNITLNYGITLDVLGDNTVQNGHPPPVTRAGIARRLATCYSDESNLDDYTEIDVASFESVETDHPAFLGYYWTDQISKAEALNQVMGGILGWWHIRPNGQLAIGYTREPNSINSVQNMEYKSEGMGLIEIIDTIQPRWTTKIGWQKNYTQQTRDQLAGVVSQGAATVYEGQSFYAESKDATVHVLYPTARIVTIDGGFRDQDDAQVEADRQQIMMGKERRRYRWEMQIDPFADLINQVVTITNVNRLSLGAAKPLLCVSIDTPGIGATTTEWWG